MTSKRTMCLVLSRLAAASALAMMVGCGAEDLSAPSLDPRRAAALRVEAGPAVAELLPALPGGWRTASFGSSAALGGGASAEGGRYLVSGGGGDFWGSRDHGTMIYREVSGNFDLVARLDSYAGDTSDGEAKGLVLFKEHHQGRDEPTDSGAAVFQSIAYDAADRWYERTTTGAAIAGSRSARLNGVGGSVWLRLTRTGNVFRTYHRDAVGAPWVQHSKSRTVAPLVHQGSSRHLSPTTANGMRAISGIACDNSRIARGIW